jgi:hypothetical protein
MDLTQSDLIDLVLCDGFTYGPAYINSIDKTNKLVHILIYPKWEPPVNKSIYWGLIKKIINVTQEYETEDVEAYLNEVDL